MDTYEKKYKESLALMVDCIPDEDGYVHVRPQDIFPELRESEDEKIRKSLIILLQHFCKGYRVPGLEFPVSYKDMLAWLEKQGEHKKFRDSIQVGDEVTRNSDGVIVNLSQLKRVAKKSEQKLPIEKLPEEMKTIEESLGFTTQKECDEYNQMVSGLIMSDDNKEEQKQNVDNKKLTDVNHEYFSELLENDDSKDINDYAYQVAYCMSHDWLEETATWEDVQKAVKLGAEWQKQKLTWSEEDEEIRKWIINEIKIKHHNLDEDNVDFVDKAIAWLEKQEGCEYIKKDWLEHIKQSWYKEGFIDGKYNGGTSKEWTINDAVTLKELIDFLENGTAKLQHDLTLYANWLKTQFSPNEKQGEQKPAWSCEDEKEYKYVLRFVDNILNNCGNKKDYEHSKRCYDWLKSLKDKIKGE